VNNRPSSSINENNTIWNDKFYNLNYWHYDILYVLLYYSYLI
jgi:hypothetical protein